MSYRLEWIFQYRLLLSKKTELHMGLTAAEQSRLERLARQLTLDVPRVYARDATRLPEPLRAEYVHLGRFHAARVCNASGAGLAVLTPESPEIGQHLQLHVWDPSGSIRYTFPARVIARFQDDAGGIRLRFEGLPAQMPLLSPSVVSRSPLRPTRFPHSFG